VTTFYETGSYGQFVDAVEVERFTDSSVWIRGRRRSRASTWKNYFETRQLAWDYLIGKAQAKLDGAEARVRTAQIDLKKIVDATSEDSHE